MKLLIVRHGDPDYSIDSLTQKGWDEAAALAEQLSKIDAKAYYVSPLGRARDTASLTMKKLGKEAQVMDWLREFPSKVVKPNHPDRQWIAWDWLPADWSERDYFYHPTDWMNAPEFEASTVRQDYAAACEGIDAILKAHGYERQGRVYHAVRPSNDTLVFFCHFGLECVLLSHLLNISPMQLWHGFCAAPTSVTTVVTEERRPGIAAWRVLSFGDVSHLVLKDQKPSFAARFCECYDNEDERRD